MNKLIPFFLTLIFILTGQSAFGANAGDLDTTFGTGGKVYAVPANFMPAEDVAIQADGSRYLDPGYRSQDLMQSFTANLRDKAGPV